MAAPTGGFGGGGGRWLTEAAHAFGENRMLVLLSPMCCSGNDHARLAVQKNNSPVSNPRPSSDKACGRCLPPVLRPGLLSDKTWHRSSFVIHCSFRLKDTTTWRSGRPSCDDSIRWCYGIPAGS